jgi:hypothetical protein
MWLFRNTGFIFLVPLSVAAFGLLYAVFVVWFGLLWLDGVQPPVLGWLLHPVELILNRLAFPHVVTRVHGNGAALFFSWVSADSSTSPFASLALRFVSAAP